MAELNFGLLTPPGSQNIGNAFVQGMDQAAVARARENQNAMSQYALSKAKREDQVKNQLLGDLRAAKTPEEQIQAYVNAGMGREAVEMQGIGLRNTKTKNEILAQPGVAAKTRAQTNAANLAAGKSRQDFRNQGLRDMANNPSDANIVANHEDAVLQGMMTKEESAAQTEKLLAIPLDQRKAIFAQAGAPAAAPRQPNLATDLLIPSRDGTMGLNTALINVRKELRPAGTTVNVKTEQAYGGAVAAGAAKQDLAQIDRAQSLPQEFAKIDETLGLLRNTDINTGLGADLFTVLDKARAQVTLDKKAGKRAVNTEYLDSLLGSAVFPQIQALGIGARGLDTPAEREFLRKVLTGSIGLTKDTLIQMTELRRKGLESEAARFNKRVEGGEFKPFEEAARRKVEAVTVPRLPTTEAKGAAPVKISGDAEYDKLPSGTLFIDPEGIQRRKP
jgi:hypothetical protein